MAQVEDSAAKVEDSAANAPVDAKLAAFLKFVDIPKPDAELLDADAHASGATAEDVAAAHAFARKQACEECSAIAAAKGYGETTAERWIHKTYKMAFKAAIDVRLSDLAPKPASAAAADAGAGAGAPRADAAAQAAAAAAGEALAAKTGAGDASAASHGAMGGSHLDKPVVTASVSAILADFGDAATATPVSARTLEQEAVYAFDMVVDLMTYVKDRVPKTHQLYAAIETVLRLKLGEGAVPVAAEVHAWLVALMRLIRDNRVLLSPEAAATPELLAYLAGNVDMWAERHPDIVRSFIGNINCSLSSCFKRASAPVAVFVAGVLFLAEHGMTFGDAIEPVKAYNVAVAVNAHTAEHLFKRVAFELVGHCRAIKLEERKLPGYTRRCIDAFFDRVPKELADEIRSTVGIDAKAASYAGKTLQDIVDAGVAIIKEVAARSCGSDPDPKLARLRLAIMAVDPGVDTLIRLATARAVASGGGRSGGGKIAVARPVKLADKHCDEHGMNTTHTTVRCWKLHPELKPPPESVKPAPESAKPSRKTATVAVFTKADASAGAGGGGGGAPSYPNHLTLAPGERLLAPANCTDCGKLHVMRSAGGCFPGMRACEYNAGCKLKINAPGTAPICRGSHPPLTASELESAKATQSAAMTSHAAGKPRSGARK